MEWGSCKWFYFECRWFGHKQRWKTLSYKHHMKSWKKTTEYNRKHYNHTVTKRQFPRSVADMTGFCQWQKKTKGMFGQDGCMKVEWESTSRIAKKIWELNLVKKKQKKTSAYRLEKCFTDYSQITSISVAAPLPYTPQSVFRPSTFYAHWNKNIVKKLNSMLNTFYCLYTFDLPSVSINRSNEPTRQHYIFQKQKMLLTCKHKNRIISHLMF